MQFEMALVVECMRGSTDSCLRYTSEGQGVCIIVFLSILNFCRGLVQM